MTFRYTRWILFTLVVFGGVGSSIAQTRTWEKIHATVGIPGDPPIATYTKIVTTDSVSPVLKRVLVEDKNQQLLVYREEYEQDASVKHGISSMTLHLELLSTGESLQITVSANGSGTLIVGGTSITYTDDDDALNLPSSVTTAAVAALDTTSADFKSAVAAFVKLGRMYSGSFDVASYSIARLLFPHLQQVNVTDDLTIPESHVPEFDPQATPPGSFELSFGNAYYQ